jgi:hypothetical protein
MQDKKKKTKKAIRVQDIKPAKDPKGGAPPDPCRPRGGDAPGGTRGPGGHRSVDIHI